MNDIEVEIRPEVFNPVYIPYYKNKSRYLHLFGGSGSGKSIFACQKILLRVLKENKHRFLIVRKVFHTHRQSTFFLFKKLIYDWNLSELFTINETNLTIKCLNGNEILFVGVDNVEKLKSIADITGVWIEEATELTENDFKQLRLRVRGKTSNYIQWILTYNPINEFHWLKTKYHDHKQDNVTLLCTTYKDNKFLDNEYVEFEILPLEIEDPAYWKIYGLGIWASVRGLIYTNWVTDNTEPSLYQDVIYGLDFGFTNSFTALTKVGRIDNDLYLKELLYQTHLTNPELISLLKGFNLGNSLIYCDSAEPKTIKELRDAGFNAVASDKSVHDGIMYVKKYNLHILPDSPNLEMELKSYKWKEKDGVPLNEPVKFREHLMDSIRYSVFTHGAKYWKKISEIIHKNRKRPERIKDKLVAY